MSGEPWTFIVVVNGHQVERFEVPEHRMTDGDVQKLLRAIVVRHRTEKAVDMMPYYLNRRRGSPKRAASADVIAINEHARVGWIRGSHMEAIAYAYRALSPDTAAVVSAIQQRTLAAG